MKTRARPAEPPVGVRRQQKEQTREDLLAAARRVLAKRGLAGATSREIAKEAGVAAGTFFVHFPDVDALVEALLDDHIAAALASARRTLPKEPDLVRRLVHVSKKLFESYDVEPDLSRAFLASSLFSKREDGPTAPRLREFQGWVAEQIAATLGEAPALDPRLAFTVYFSVYFTLLVAGLRGQVTRKEQLATLDAALRRVFGMEARS